MKIIDLYSKISNKEIKGGQAFRIDFKNGLHRDFYYDDKENNETACLKNISDGYPLYDDIKLNDEIEIIDKVNKINEIIDKINKESDE